jgi:hypothetical protein
MHTYLDSHYTDQNIDSTYHSVVVNGNDGMAELMYVRFDTGLSRPSHEAVRCNAYNMLLPLSTSD